MNQNMIIQTEDFNTYYFDIPKLLSAKIFSRSHLEHFIFAELEKIHPFFGPHCKVDFRIVMENQKLQVCVVVIDAIILESYQSENESRPLYAKITNDPRMHPKKVFRKASLISKKNVSVFAVVVLAFFVSQIFIPVVNSEKKEFVTFNDESLVKTVEGSVLTSLFFFQLSDWLKSGVTCTSISYSKINKNQKNNDYKIEIATAFEGLNVEQMYPAIMQQDLYNDYSLRDAITINPVVFREGIPHTSLFFTELYKDGKSNLSEHNTVFDYSTIRELVSNHNGYMQQENWGTQEYVFSVPVSHWEIFYTQLYEHLSVNLNTLQSFSFSINGDASLIAATICIVDGAMPEYFAILKDLFHQQERLYFKKNIHTAVSTNNNENQLQFIAELREIGNIKKTDGSWITFYVNHDGKIIAQEN